MRKCFFGELAGSLLAVATLVCAASPAWAQQRVGADEAGAENETSDPHWRPGFGVRVGGYGFRHSDGEKDIWDDCKMQGIGVFGTLDYNEHLFGEVGIDNYTAAPSVRKRGMDRVSTHALFSVGLRMFPDFFISPNVQLGGGGEWTRIEVPAQDIVMRELYPVGFLGFGAEINATDNLKLGASFRMLLSMHPEHYEAGEGDVQWDAETASLSGEEQTRFSVDPDVAAQAQFFLRYAL